MKRYSQPKAGTNDKTVKKDIAYHDINRGTKAGNVLESLQHIYKGEIKLEWQ